MKELLARNDLLGKPVAIRAELDANGYVLFRDVIDTGLIDHARQSVMAWFSSQDFIKDEHDLPVWTGRDLTSLGSHPKGLSDTHVWEWLALHPKVRQVLEQVLGDPGYVLPMGEYQFSWPNRPDCWSRIHQDGAFNPGLNFLTFWIPLVDVTAPLGGLAIYPGRHNGASLHPSLEELGGLDYIPQELLPTDGWHRADYHPGDMVVFDPWTPHCGLPNESNQLRLSVDIRVQSAAATRPVIGVVVDTDADSLTIASDDQGVIRVYVDESTLLRKRTYSGDRVVSLGDYRGDRIMVGTSDGNRAQLVRYPFEYVPSTQ
jgi:phytanoyl-CoA dioxygenase PhyH